MSWRVRRNFCLFKVHQQLVIFCLEKIAVAGDTVISVRRNVNYKTYSADELQVKYVPA